MKNEARYENPVNLYISKSYDDAETAQNFIKSLAGEQLTVSKSRNGDYLYVSIEGSNEDIDAFLDVYKDTFTDIVWDCDADANGWVKPKDVYDSIGQDGKVLPEESKVGEGRSNEDYLQEVWDSLAVAWDKDKFNMGKGYDSEYECECITITPKDNEEVRAKIYVEDYNGRHPAAFNVVYRYPGDKGVGVMGTYEFQSTDMDGLGEEVFDYFDEIKQKAGESKKSEAKGPTTGDDALKQMQTAFKQYNGKTTGEIAADIRYDVATALDMPADEVDDVMQSFGLDNIYILRAEGVSPKAIAQKMLKASNEAKKSEDFDMNKAFFQAKKAITDWTKNQKHKTLEWLYTDGRKSPTSYPSGIWDFEWDTGNGMAMAELKVSPYETRTNSWNDSLDFALKSGPEGKYMYYTSAEDVLYALDKLIRDTEFKGESKKSESDETSWALEYLVETAKEKGLKVSWEGSNEICITIGTFPHQDHIFVTDDAPGKDDTSLELYVPAAHINTSGLTLQDVLDYLDDPIGKRDAVQFKNGNRPGKVEAKKSEGLPPKRLGSKRQYRSRADLINKMKQLGAVEITTSKQFNDIKDSQWLHTAGYALDTNGNLVAQSYYGDKDGKWYYTSTRNFDGDYLPESKQHENRTKEEEVTNIFKGMKEWADRWSNSDKDRKTIADNLDLEAVQENMSDIVEILDNNFEWDGYGFKFVVVGDYEDDDTRDEADANKWDRCYGVCEEIADLIGIPDEGHAIGEMNIHFWEEIESDWRDDESKPAESKKSEADEHIEFKQTEFPKELRKLYQACSERFYCEPYVSDMLESSRGGKLPKNEMTCDYTLRGSFGSDVILSVNMVYRGGAGDMTFTVTVSALDETTGRSWKRLGDATARSFDDALNAAMSEVDKNLMPFAVKVRSAKKGESKKSESGLHDAYYAKALQAVDRAIKMTHDQFDITGDVAKFDADLKKYLISYVDSLNDTRLANIGLIGNLRDRIKDFARGDREEWWKTRKQGEAKKSESLTLKQKELKDMARYGEAEDITTISDAEAKELKNKGIETVGVSRGVYGMNGALLRDKDGNKYVITARSSNLFYFV